jgi:hypothetical protein
MKLPAAARLSATAAERGGRSVPNLRVGLVLTNLLHALRIGSPDNRGQEAGLRRRLSMSEAEYKQQPENGDPVLPTGHGRAADELEYIRTETDYISSIVRSRDGLLSSDDLERVIRLTRVLERINKRLVRGPL